MNILALDIGDARTGLALSRGSSKLAVPHTSLKTADELKGAAMLRRVIEDYEIEHIVIGLPLSLDGSEGSQARHVRALAKKLLSINGWIAAEQKLEDDKRVSFVDERLSSVEAESRLIESGKSTKEIRDYSDALAAAVILESYLDRGGLNE